MTPLCNIYANNIKKHDLCSNNSRNLQISLCKLAVNYCTTGILLDEQVAGLEVFTALFLRVQLLRHIMLSLGIWFLICQRKQVPSSWNVQEGPIQRFHFMLDTHNPKIYPGIELVASWIIKYVYTV